MLGWNYTLVQRVQVGHNSFFQEGSFCIDNFAQQIKQLCHWFQVHTILDGGVIRSDLETLLTLQT